MSNGHLEFRYFGFYDALKRYRSTTVVGWGVTAAGAAGFVLSWGIPGGRGLLDAALAGATVLAGLAVVHVSVMGLQSYVSVPFPPFPQELPEHERAALQEIEPVMIDVRDGGWQDAFHAMGQLRAIGGRRGLPPPDRREPAPVKHQQQEK